MRFQDAAPLVIQETQDVTDALRTSVILAREYLKDVVVAPEQVGGRAGPAWRGMKASQDSVVVAAAPAAPRRRESVLGQPLPCRKMGGESSGGDNS